MNGKFLHCAFVFFALLVMAGCASTPQFDKGEDLNELLTAYKERSAEIEAQQRDYEKAAIRTLVVAPDPARNGAVVTADLRKAPVSSVVVRILEAAKEPYNLSAVRLSGIATVKFDRLPVVDALNQIMSASGFSVSRRDGILLFRHGANIPTAFRGPARSSSDGAGGDDSGDRVKTPVYEEFMLKYVNVDDALALLRGLYWGGNDTGDDAAVNFGALPELNTIYMSGPADVVGEAVAVLDRADRDVPHVLIEVLIVDFDLTAATSLGSTITDGATGDFSGLGLAAGQTSGNISLSFLQGAMNPAQLTATIDLLVSHNKAQVISRPYIAARSTQTASIQIVNDRFVSITRSIDGAAIATTDSINAGVQLSVTPTVQASDVIRLDMQVEESQFVATVADILVEKDRNTASTSVSVRSGQTIVVGGLNLQRLVENNAGLPWLRKIPILNLLSGEQTSLDQNRELVVYLTPRIWEPNMTPDLAAPDALNFDNEPLTGFEEFRGAVSGSGAH